MKRLAVRSALNARALEDRLLVVDPLELEAPRTKTVLSLLEAMDVASGNVLLLTDGLKREVYLSARNLPKVLVRPWGEVSAYDVLWADAVLVESSALTPRASNPAVEES